MIKLILYHDRERLPDAFLLPDGDPASLVNGLTHALESVGYGWRIEPGPTVLVVEAGPERS